MPIRKRRPPTNRRRLADVSLGQRLDTFEDNPPRPIRQERPRRLRRKYAAGRRPLGPGEVAALDAPQGQYLTRSTEPEVTHLSVTTSYDFIPPNWHRLGFVLGQVATAATSRTAASTRLNLRNTGHDR